MVRLLHAYRPRRFARCLVQPVQGLRNRGTTAIGGRPAVVLTAGKHRPDALSLAIAAEGSPVLLRAVERGPVSPASGADRACGRQRAHHWAYRFSHFDELASISRPRGPIYGNPEGLRRRGRVT
jgi:hypothetical protein